MNGYILSLGIKIERYMNNHFNKYDSQDINTWIKKIALQENAIEIIKEKIKKEALILSVELSSPIKHFNVVICGKTGIGKSTLINGIFDYKGDNRIPTGIGKPITKGVPKVYESDKIKTLRIYDSQGIELKNHDVNSTVQEMETLIETKAREKNPDCFIHAIWYCIGVPGSIFEDSEKEAIKQLKSIYADDKLPIIIVLTQAYDLNNLEEFKKIIKDEINTNASIIRVLAQENPCCKPYGLDQLLETTFNEAIKSTNSATFYSLQLDLANKLNQIGKSIVENLSIETQEKVSALHETYQTLISEEDKTDIILNFNETILLNMFSLKDKLTVTLKSDLNIIIAKYITITNEIIKQFLNEQITEQAILMTNNYLACKLQVETTYNVLLSQKMTMDELMAVHMSVINNMISNQVKILFQKVVFITMIKSFIEQVQKESCLVYEESLKNMKTSLQDIAQEVMANRIQELRAMSKNTN